VSDGDQNLGDLSMLDLFRMEVEAQSAVLNQGLLALERDPASTEDLESLMRAAHSIKGAARIVNLDTAVTLAHAMEDCFVAAQKGEVQFSADGIDTLLRSVDALTSLSEADDPNAWLTEHGAEVEAISTGIEAVLAGEPVPAPSEPPEEEAPESAPEEEAESGDGAGGTGGAGETSLLDLFRQELEVQSAGLTKGLLALEASPTSAETLESLMRAAHSIKGAARIVNLDVAVALAHAMEDCFVAAQEGEVTLGADDIDVLLQGVDTLNCIAQAPEAEAWLGGHAAEVGDLVDAILAVRLCGDDGKPDVAAPEEPPRVEPAEEKPPREGGPAPTAVSNRVVRVTAANLDRLMGLTGECLVEAGWLQPFAESLLRLKGCQAKLAGQLEQFQESVGDGAPSGRDRTHASEARRWIGECREMLAGCLNDFEQFSRRLHNLTERLYSEVISSRMRPFSDGAQGFPRTVRDVARKLGKKARLEIVGEATEVDRDILERLEAPLGHILRNAVDHGIENPAERLAADKPAEGTIRLAAAHRAGMLCISISDDGRGVNTDRLREKVVRQKLAAEEIAADLSETELLEFLFLPGFSTAGKVTEISGRGVGMDVVHSMVQEVGGSVRVESDRGKGMTVHLQLPITLSVLRTLLVEIAAEPYAFPLARIDRILMLPPDQVELLEDKQYFQLDGRNIGVIPAQQLFTRAPSSEHSGDLPVVVISDRLNQYGLVVDRFLGERDLVVRALDPRLGKVKDISAAALMEDGSPLLIVDVDDMVRSIDNLLSGGRLRKLGRAAEQVEGKKRKRILIVDDSITVREVQRKLLENRGYEAEVAVDGMDGWNAVRAGEYDLIISDVDMPRMNGIEFVGRIKQDPGLKSLPVLIVSYKDREEDRQLGLQAGANYYLTKSSFHDESLLNAVIDLIGEPHA